MAHYRFVARSTHRLNFSVYKNGVIWDLIGATVTVLMVKTPGGDERTFSATVSSPPDTAPNAYYDTLTTDFTNTVTESWSLRLKIEQGAITEYTESVAVTIVG